ncbi:testis-expressed protein 12-like isoform X2 [Labrus bergylta]
MEESTPMTGKMLPPVLPQRAMKNSKGPKQPTPHETAANQDTSPPMKRKAPSKPSTSESADIFEVTAAGASREFRMLSSKFAQVLCERAAADSAQMEELDGLLREAQNFQAYLIGKKNLLKQTLASISDKLQG